MNDTTIDTPNVDVLIDDLNWLANEYSKWPTIRKAAEALRTQQLEIDRLRKLLLAATEEGA